jgi:hypothetical protein
MWRSDGGVESWREILEDAIFFWKFATSGEQCLFISSTTPSFTVSLRFGLRTWCDLQISVKVSAVYAVLS